MRQVASPPYNEGEEKEEMNRDTQSYRYSAYLC